MISGGGEGTRVGGGLCRNSTAAHRLFLEFGHLYEAVAKIRTSKDVPRIKIPDGEKWSDIKLSKHDFVQDLQAYSRTTRLDDGKWITVQVRRWSGGLFWHVALDVFDGEGRLIAAVRDSDCDGQMAITPQEKSYGKDEVIQSALLAVTGKKFPVAVAEE